MKINLDRYINPAVKNAPPDESILTGNLADKMEAEGISLIHMDLGRPDFDTPEPAKAAAKRALDEGKVFYTSLNGITELKEAIAAYEKEGHGIDADPEKNVLVTVGASEALFEVWLNFLKPGDEVLIPTPCYCSYLYMLACLGAKAVEVPTVRADGSVEFDIEMFRKKLTPNTKMIMINSPQNPTGMVYTKEQLETIAALAIENDLLVISDECYDKYLFTGEHHSLATFPGMWERTFTINSTSKTYSMTGWRVGYVIAHEAFLDVMAATHANLILCAPSFVQYGAAEAFRSVKDEIASNLTEYRRRRDLVVSCMDRTGLPYVKPEGAFYLFFDVGSLGMKGLDFCLKLLEEEHVTSMPGSIYGDDYHSWVRLAYTCGYDDLKTGMERIVSFIDRNRK
ncbi:pyridoxal phosphate-dependent aminotransferase [Oscillospiraceae bacterium OttesenSCG-928-G22]|nr:pyridoxal phosphate-dependent aminotransferase [Oscillospiraceae bacterium OttesenSCG-928-G22]